MEGVEVIGMCSWRVQLISIKVFEKHLKLVFFVYIITSRPNVLKKKKGNSTKGQFTFCTSDYFDCQGVRTVILTFLLPHDCKLSCHKIELMKSYLC